MNRFMTMVELFYLWIIVGPLLNLLLYIWIFIHYFVLGTKYWVFILKHYEHQLQPNHDTMLVE